MEIRILLDITDKLDKALRRIAYAIIAGGVAAFAKDETAQNQDVPAEDDPAKENARTDGAPKADDAPNPAPKKRAKAKKPSSPAVEICTSAAIAEGGQDGDGTEESVAEAKAENAAEPAAASRKDNESEHGKGIVGDIVSTAGLQANPPTAHRLAREETPESEQEPAKKLYGVYLAAATMQAHEDAPTQENEDELGKGAIGEIISELTGRLINRMNEEARDKATINRNLRAKCEELQLKFPTVPALIQAIGYGNAYKACIGEG